MTPDPDIQKKDIVIVDDHPLVREWLATLINQQSDLKTLGEADNAADALKLIAAAKPDLAIVDISMPGGSGIELIKQIKAGFPNVQVLVLSMHDEKLYRERAFGAGARGYVTKRGATREVLQAIRWVLEGKIYSGEVAPAAADDGFVGLKTPATDYLVERLSDRELEVFHLLGRGFGTRQIAGELHVNFRTVQTFCARIKKKLGLSNATKLLREATSWLDRQNFK
ncbi:MAG: response regulator transcription factor [Verrucomicrobiota bacterium]|jgi:DNA-binding NarL/FixJ family response regulator